MRFAKDGPKIGERDGTAYGKMHFMVLKRAGRYMLALSRVVQPIPMERTATELSTFYDADHAGCIRSR